MVMSNDLLDVYLGGEGMYGVITELTLRLIPKPKEIWGIGFFFENPEEGMSFADQLKATPFDSQDANIAAMEYLDQTILSAVEMHPSMKIQLKTTPGTAPHITAMVYVEIHGDHEDAIQEIAHTLLNMSSTFNSDIDKTWAFSGEPEVDKMRHFLHAAAETAILHIEKARREDHRITKTRYRHQPGAGGAKDPGSPIRKKTSKGKFKSQLLGAHWQRQPAHRYPAGKLRGVR